MAIGGDNALLKIFKLNDSSARVGAIGNQTLMGHTGRVLRIAWNRPFRKLCTADEHGVIIVWTIEQNRFVEEMINSSDHAPVGDVKWSLDGKNICIVYGDGAIVVGSVGGDRLWAKSVDVSHQRLEWSPDGSNILIASTDATISVYDMSGNVVKEFDNDGATDIVDLRWHRNSSPDRKNFVVAHSYGDVYFRNALQHDSKSRIDCGITIENCKWNDDGKILAVCGVLNETDPNEPHASVVNFYSRDGILLYSLKVPTTECIFDVLWDPSGKLLVAFENSVFFASVHTPSTFTAVGNTMAYISSDTVSTFDKAMSYTNESLVANEHCYHRVRPEESPMEKRLPSLILRAASRTSINSARFYTFAVIDTCA